MLKSMSFRKPLRLGSGNSQVLRSEILVGKFDFDHICIWACLEKYFTSKSYRLNCITVFHGVSSRIISLVSVNP